jgi:hypothetical protein
LYKGVSACSVKKFVHKHKEEQDPALSILSKMCGDAKTNTALFFLDLHILPKSPLGSQKAIAQVMQVAYVRVEEEDLGAGFSVKITLLLIGCKVQLE